ncbi:PIN domain-containing protein [Promicromonospora sp. NPDC019610]|uniref:PIN domain-containing protein n=1 Tax=Promicromonospora sp. NPDC019610 TaxID=3364405 RepID=UPI00378E4C04
MAERLPQGLLDTSVVIDLENIPPADLPVEVAICAITPAELAAAPAATTEAAERARRQDRLQRTGAAFDPIPFDLEAARSYARVYAAVVAQGRKPRRRLADLLIASVALTEGLPVITRNPDDSSGWRSSSTSRPSATRTETGLRLCWSCS